MSKGTSWYKAMIKTMEKKNSRARARGGRCMTGAGGEGSKQLSIGAAMEGGTVPHLAGQDWGVHPEPRSKGLGDTWL